MKPSPLLKIIFMGSPDFSVPVLAQLIGAGHEIVAVYSQPPRGAKRGQKIRKSPVHQFADDNGLPVHTPENFKDEKTVQEFCDLKADVAIVVAYGLILPKPLLDAPKLGCINVHASVLPRWRGAAPIQRAILAGDIETGISIMQMDTGLDTGAVLATEKTPISVTTTATTLHDTLAEMGARMAERVLHDFALGKISAVPQPDTGITYAEKLNKQEGRLNWALSPAQLGRQIRALNPWPGVWFPYKGEHIKVLAAEISENKCGTTPGYVMTDDLMVACCSGAVKINRLQRPGKKPMFTADFLRGYSLPKGTHLK